MLNAMEMDGISSSGSSHSFGHSYDSQAMDVSGDTVTTQTIDGDGIIELVVYPPVYDNDLDKMLLADTLRLGKRLPTDHCLPGYYLTDDGEVVVSYVVSANEAEPQNSLVQRSEEKESRKRANRAKPYEKIPPRIPEEVIHRASALLEHLVSLHSIAANQRELCHPEPLIDISNLHSGIPVCAYALEPSFELAGASTGPGKGMPRKRKCFSVDTSKVTAHSALYTTTMSWGRQQSPSEAISTDQDDEDDSEDEDDDFRGCRLGLETGSSLSWVYKQGYRQMRDPRRVTMLPLTEWDQSGRPVSDYSRANQHMSVSFSSEFDSALEYDKTKTIRYADGTAVAPIPFSDLVTLHGASPRKELPLTFLGALAVTRKLMLREDYDGLLGLSPRPAASEEKIQPLTQPFLHQLRDLAVIGGSKFYMTFGADRAQSSKLSLGGIKKSLYSQHTWSPWMRIVGRANLTWSLYLDAISLHNTAGGSAVDSLSLVPPDDSPSPERSHVHFDTGCSHSHYAPTIIDFLMKNDILLVEESKFYCRLDKIKGRYLVFHLRSGCLQQTWTIEMPATMLAEPMPHSVEIHGCLVARATVSGTGKFQKEVNMWGNKHMRGMGFGFDTDHFSMQLGMPGSSK